MLPFFRHLLAFFRKNCKELPWLVDMADERRRNIRLTLHDDGHGHYIWIEIKVFVRGDLYLHLATNDPQRRDLFVALSNEMEERCGTGIVILRRPPSGWTRIGYMIINYDNVDRLFEKICECLKRLKKYFDSFNLQ
jgi:hypothetical protein